MPQPDITHTLIQKRAGVGQGAMVARGSWQRTLTNIRNLPNTHDHHHTRIQHPHPCSMVDQPHPHKGPQVHAAHTGMGHRNLDKAMTMAQATQMNQEEFDRYEEGPLVLAKDLGLSGHHENCEARMIEKDGETILGLLRCVDGCPTMERTKDRGRALAEQHGW